MNRCPSCGELLETEHSFCTKCGAKIPPASSGTSLQSKAEESVIPLATTPVSSGSQPTEELPDIPAVPTSPLVEQTTQSEPSALTISKEKEKLIVSTEKIRQASVSSAPLDEDDSLDDSFADKHSPYTPLSTGRYIGIFLLMLIPVVNLVLLIAWSFGASKNINKINWARATLIFILVGIILAVALYFLLPLLPGSISSLLPF